MQGKHTTRQHRSTMAYLSNFCVILPILIAKFVLMVNLAHNMDNLRQAGPLRSK